MNIKIFVGYFSVRSNGAGAAYQRPAGHRPGRSEGAHRLHRIQGTPLFSFTNNFDNNDKIVLRL